MAERDTILGNPLTKGFHMRMLLIAALGMMLSKTAHAGMDRTHCWPDSRQYFSQYEATGITLTQFNRVIDKLERAFASKVKAKGATLEVNRYWDDGTVNAYAHRNGSTWYIDMYGGFARYPGMTEAGFAVIACHEMGHHLAGQPTYGRGTDWAAVEGQSDWWATRVCMPALGYNGERGGWTVAKILAIMGGEDPVSPTTPDRTKVSVTMESHPPGQCRGDTYRAGHRKYVRRCCWYKGKSAGTCN